MHEDCDLRFAHDQLGSVFDLLILHWKAVQERVGGVVEPFDNFDEL
jgi:hypothetical protein